MPRRGDGAHSFLRAHCSHAMPNSMTSRMPTDALFLLQHEAHHYRCRAKVSRREYAKMRHWRQDTSRRPTTYSTGFAFISFLALKPERVPLASTSHFASRRVSIYTRLISRGGPLRAIHTPCGMRDKSATPLTSRDLINALDFTRREDIIYCIDEHRRPNCFFDGSQGPDVTPSNVTVR